MFARAAADRSIRLRIFTALTLERPRPRGELEQRFVAQLAERIFAGYPDLAYAAALHEGRLTANIEVDEFFFQAGSRLVRLYRHDPGWRRSILHLAGLGLSNNGNEQTKRCRAKKPH